MKKNDVKNTIVERQINLIYELKGRVQTTHSMVDLDEEDVRDPEDFSHQYESAEMEQLLKIQLNNAERNLERINSINFEPKYKVQLGALVQTNRQSFLIGLSSLPFTLEDRTIVGISMDSPIYLAMLGKIEGQSFTHCGINYIIEKIL